MESEDNRLKKIRQRYHVVQEIIEFEKKFVEDLSTFDEIVVDPLLKWIEEVETQSSGENVEIYDQKISPLPDDSIDTIKVLLNSLKNYVLGFSNLVKNGLTEVYNDSTIKDSCPIAVFLKKGNIIPFYGMYSPYILNYDNAMEKIVQLRKARPDFHVFLRACELQKAFKQMSIEGYLILPIQHIPRTALLLEELLKCTPKTNEANDDYDILSKAKEKVEEVLMGMNEKLSLKENRDKVIEFATKFQDNQANKKRNKIQENQSDYKSNWIEPHRLYVKDGFLRKICRNGYQKYIFVLFNDKLIYGKESLSRGTFGREYECHREFDLDSVLIINLGNLYAEDEVQDNNKRASISKPFTQDKNSIETISPQSVSSIASTGTQNSDNSGITSNSLASIRSIGHLSNMLGQEYDRSFIIVYQPKSKELADHRKSFIVSCNSMEEKRSWIIALNHSFNSLKKGKEKENNVFTLPLTLFDNQICQENTEFSSHSNLSLSNDGFLPFREHQDRKIIEEGFTLYLEKDQQVDCNIELQVDLALVHPQLSSTAEMINSADKKKNNFGILLEETLRIEAPKQRHPRRLSKLLGWNAKKENLQNDNSQTDAPVMHSGISVDENPQIGFPASIDQKPKEENNLMRFESLSPHSFNNKDNKKENESQSPSSFNKKDTLKENHSKNFHQSSTGLDRETTSTKYSYLDSLEIPNETKDDINKKEATIDQRIISHGTEPPSLPKIKERRRSTARKPPMKDKNQSGRNSLDSQIQSHERMELDKFRLKEDKFDRINDLASRPSKDATQYHQQQHNTYIQQNSLKYTGALQALRKDQKFEQENKFYRNIAPGNRMNAK